MKKAYLAFAMRLPLMALAFVPSAQAMMEQQQEETASTARAVRSDFYQRFEGAVKKIYEEETGVSAAHRSFSVPFLDMWGAFYQENKVELLTSLQTSPSDFRETVIACLKKVTLDLQGANLDDIVVGIMTPSRPARLAERLALSARRVAANKCQKQLAVWMGVAEESLEKIEVFLSTAPSERAELGFGLISRLSNVMGSMSMAKKEADKLSEV